jgi:formamidopyrimidine-DNA glycosylase
MAGKIVVDDEADEESRWDRFALRFADGTRLALRDKRRLGRAVLNPDFSHVGPDAAGVDRDAFRRLVGAGHTALKARLLNQHAIAGVGNLLADQALWQARLAPRRDTGSLSEEELDRLRRELRQAIRSATRLGGVHTGRFVRARRHEGVCPRDGHVLERATVGGRTTFWCPACQR